MKTKISLKHIAFIAAVVLVWTLVVIGFSTSLGERPLRMYDWGPPTFAGLITLVVMMLDARRKD